MSERLEQLKELLTNERAALLSQDFSTLGKSTEAVDAFISDLECNKLDLDKGDMDLMTEVQGLAKRNASLLAAGLEGIRIAREKVEMIKRATSQLNTYTSDGTVEDVTINTGKVEKRA